MYCKFCGEKIDSDSVYCTFCGEKQSEENKPFFNAAKNKIKPGECNTENSYKEVYEPVYDSFYIKETEATIAGGTLLVISFLFLLIGPFQFDSIQTYNEFRGITLIIGLILRVSITIWVANIAKRQNRGVLGWSLFALFFPSIALIVIGQMKKLYAKFFIDPLLSKEENSIILTEKAKIFLDEKKYNECIRFSEKAIELYPENDNAKRLLVKARTNIPLNEVANRHSQTVYREMQDGKVLKLVSKNYQTIGTEVFLNDELAPDGEYQYKKDSRKITVKDGVIITFNS